MRIRGRKPSWTACWVSEKAPEMMAWDALLETRREQDPALTRQDLMREAVARYLAAERRKAKRR
jgi:hypothetical protein